MKPKAIVFYSWQSDIKAAANRSLILDALEAAAKELANVEEIAVEPVIDRDTASVPGAPDIGKTIFEKIDASAVVVADVTIVNPGAGTRPTPNPNVMIELGYALRSVGGERVVLVQNTAFGKPEVLPFDLRQKRVLTYESAEDAQSRAPERKALQARLREALLLILQQPSTAPEPADQRTLWTPEAEASEEAAKSFISQSKFDGLGRVDYAIHPVTRNPLVATHPKVREAIQKSVRDYRGWPHPNVDEKAANRRDNKSGSIFLSGAVEFLHLAEAWSAFANGYYRFTRILSEDLEAARGRSAGWEPAEPKSYLNWIQALFEIAEAFSFASRFTKELGYTGALSYQIRYSGLSGRIIGGGKNDFMIRMRRYTSRQDEIVLSGAFSNDEDTSRDTRILETARDLFSMFGWPIDEPFLRQQLDNLYNRRF